MKKPKRINKEEYLIKLLCDMSVSTFGSTYHIKTVCRIYEGVKNRRIKEAIARIHGKLISVRARINKSGMLNTPDIENRYIESRRSMSNGPRKFMGDNPKVIDRMKTSDIFRDKELRNHAQFLHKYLRDYPRIKARFVRSESNKRRRIMQTFRKMNLGLNLDALETIVNNSLTTEIRFTKRGNRFIGLYLFGTAVNLCVGKGEIQAIKRNEPIRLLIDKSGTQSEVTYSEYINVANDVLSKYARHILSGDDTYWYDGSLEGYLKYNITENPDNVIEETIRSINIE